MVLSLALILLGTGVKSARPRLVIRLVAALTVVAAFGTTMAFLYPDSELYDRMEGPNRANVPAVYEAFGFPYCFLHNFNLYPVDKPPDTTPRRLHPMKTPTGKQKLRRKPHPTS